MSSQPSAPIWKAATIAVSFAAGVGLTHIYHTRRLTQHSKADPTQFSVPSTALLAGVELGGTSCRVGVAYADNPTSLFDSIELKTNDPVTTTRQIVRFLKKHEPFSALGIASFGPIDLNRDSPTYGYITTTPKPGWQHFNLLAAFTEFNVPIGFDTDVNAPALAEIRYGGHDGDSCAYVTVGTGIGVGLVVNRAPVHGLVHPEGGHIMPLRKQGDVYGGFSNMHRGSVESHAAAQACAERIGVDMKELATVGDEHPAWDDIAYYLAQLCISITYLVSPHVIVLSGGVMKRLVLFEKIRRIFLELNEGYIEAEKVTKRVEEYIVPSGYGNLIGIIGAIELARRAAAGLRW